MDDTAYTKYLKTLQRLGKNEKTIVVELHNIIDPTLLRALGYIKNEDDIRRIHIDGKTRVNLTIQFKDGALIPEEDISFKSHGSQEKL